MVGGIRLQADPRFGDVAGAAVLFSAEHIRVGKGPTVEST